MTPPLITWSRDGKLLLSVFQPELVYLLDSAAARAIFFPPLPAGGVDSSNVEKSLPEAHMIPQQESFHD